LRVRQFWVVAFCPSSAPNERLKALGEVDQYLKSINADAHDVVARVKKPLQPELPEAIKEKIKQAFDAGYARGHAEEFEKRQRAVAAVASLGGFDVHGHNGFSWSEIAGHCLLNKHRIHNDWEANKFLPSVAERLADPSYAISAREAPILRRIFQTWFNGQI
jgi:hypothetical protein